MGDFVLKLYTAFHIPCGIPEEHPYGVTGVHKDKIPVGTTIEVRIPFDLEAMGWVILFFHAIQIVHCSSYSMCDFGGAPLWGDSGP